MRVREGNFVGQFEQFDLCNYRENQLQKRSKVSRSLNDFILCWNITCNQLLNQLRATTST